MDFALTESQEMIRKEVAALSRGFSMDYWLEKDEKAEYPHEFVKAFAEAGWLGLMIPGRASTSPRRTSSVVIPERFTAVRRPGSARETFSWWLCRPRTRAR